MNKKVRIGSEVLFTPSENTRTKKFEQTSPQDNYVAKVTGINDETVDLTVFDNGQMVYVKNIKHSSVAAEGRSKWDFQPEE